MLCNICKSPELTRRPDGTKTDSVRSNTNTKLDAKKMICSKCTALLSRVTTSINWEMNWEGLKTLVNGKKTMVRTAPTTPMMRRK